MSHTVSSALLQIVPIIMTIGGFLLFKSSTFKTVVSDLLGLFGSLLVIQPGTELFNPLSLFALAGAFLALRFVNIFNV